MCEEGGGTPFVPKSQEEFDFWNTEVESNGEAYFWYPLHDQIEEGVRIYTDGTLPSEAPFNPDVDGNSMGQNDDEKDCVNYASTPMAMTSFVFSWTICDTSPQKENLLCLRNDYIV
ncbi:UNVERIFIED_CONTAM: hypothetical protein RMT77_018963 [Armadillidium vulgare]